MPFWSDMEVPMNRPAEPLMYRTSALSRVNGQNKLTIAFGVAAALSSALPVKAVVAPVLSQMPTPARVQAEFAVERSEETALAELRRLSGLTFEQLARLFQTSRRSIHFWASGKPMSAANQEHLYRTLAVVRELCRSDAAQNREALLAPRENGHVPFDLLIGKKYGEAIECSKNKILVRLQTVPRLTAEEREARLPPPPWALVGALVDSVKIEPSEGRPAMSIKVPVEGSDS